MLSPHWTCTSQVICTKTFRRLLILCLSPILYDRSYVYACTKIIGKLLILCLSRIWSDGSWQIGAEKFRNLLFLPLSPIWSDGLRQICSEYSFEPIGLGFANIANICQFSIRSLLNSQKFANLYVWPLSVQNLLKS